MFKNIIKNNQDNSNITFWDDHLNKKYGKAGTPSRDKYEKEFEAFKIGVLIWDTRIKQHLTQEQLTERAGTTKTIFPGLKIMPVISDCRL